MLQSDHANLGDYGRGVAATTERGSRGTPPGQPGSGTVLGQKLHSIGYDATVERIARWICEDRRPRNILTVNASLLVARRDDPELRAACDDMDLAVADGVPVLWLARLLGVSLPERVAGVDLIYSLLERAHQDKLRIYFLGARQEVLIKLEALCRERFPGLVIAGMQNGYYDRSEQETICRAVGDTKPDILFIGMPSPTKEMIAYRYRDVMNVPVVLGVGGSFDVITGEIKRAPRFMRDTGLEWLWRLMMEPRKLWKRYLFGNSRFLALGAVAVGQRLMGGNRDS